MKQKYSTLSINTGQISAKQQIYTRVELYVEFDQPIERQDFDLSLSPISYP